MTADVKTGSININDLCIKTEALHILLLCSSGWIYLKIWLDARHFKNADYTEYSAKCLAKSLMKCFRLIE